MAIGPFEEATGRDANHDDDDRFQPHAAERLEKADCEGPVTHSDKQIRTGHPQELFLVQATGLDPQPAV